MSKDPAFLFYSSDFLNGVADLTMEERGQFITLLCLQHQKGSLSEKTIRLAVGSVSVDVLDKFSLDNNKNYFHPRLQLEIEKRALFTESRRNNGKKGGRKPLAYPNALPNGKAKNNHIENENENENENININRNNGEILNFEIWTQSIINKSDFIFDEMLMKEPARINFTDDDVKSHETKCIREGTKFSNQNHFRKSLLGYLKTIEQRKTNGKQLNQKDRIGGIDASAARETLSRLSREPFKPE